ncbi:trihelix transcription factor ENAP1 [Spinacia oleracea]|uniref:Trihelix transcription factor ENAP1 n=1 Tax=Spinacia oleracea TaxID=3562 RepID=A0A9R0I6R2_SPIOL|nr:trihelix transcription factor ENAP1-like [Spinacia oleracea]
MAEGPESSTPPSLAMISSSRPVPAREDCWSEDATFTLIEAWGQRYIELNRGNLRQKQWQEVADAVNSRHGHVKKARRTDVQCKNRIDTLKKKYKIEKARVLDSNGGYKSPWPFFDPLDQLIGSTMPLKKMSPSPPMAVPIIAHRTPAMLPQKRPAPSPSPPALTSAPFRGEESSYFRKNYSAIAAAAAAAAESEEEEEEEEEEDEEEVEVSGETSEADGIRKLARVIEKFGEVYARVEAEKQRQMVELEKQRMQFAKELECQRMQMLVEMQVQLEKIKRAKRSDDSNDMYS